MSSTIGHALCGIAVLMAARASSPRADVLADWRWLPAFALFANLPDLDFVVGYVLSGDVHRFHSGPSHSLLLALATGLGIGRLLPAAARAGATAWICVAIVSHLLIDLFAGPGWGWQQSYGVPLLWPFDGDRLRMPFSLFLGVQHATLGELLTWRNLQVIAVEIAMFGPPLLLLRWRTQLRKGTEVHHQGIV